MWESAQHSNLADDYRAYLDAYPAGVFAQMAKNRIALLERPAAPPVLPAPAAPGPTPAIAAPAPSPAVGAPEIGSEATERSLDLDLAARKAVQQRLQTLGAKVGAIDGEFAEQTRGSIRDWQRKHGFEPSGWLGPVQLAALKTETEENYQKLLKEQQSVHPPSGAPLAPVAARPPRTPPEAETKTRKIANTGYTRRFPAAEGARKAGNADSKRRREAQSTRESSPAPEPAFKPSKEVGPCQPHMHTVASPDPRGYRCVLDGY